MINKAISNLPTRTEVQTGSGNFIEITVGEEGNYLSTKSTISGLTDQIFSGDQCRELKNITSITNDETCTDTLLIDTTGAIIIPTGTELQRPTDTSGAIRLNTDTSSFEGYNGIAWAGLGGLNKLDPVTGVVVGSARVSIGAVPPVVRDEMDVWIDTTDNVTKRYQSGAWVILGAAYS